MRGHAWPLRCRVALPKSRHYRWRMLTHMSIVLIILMMSTHISMNMPYGTLSMPYSHSQKQSSSAEVGTLPLENRPTGGCTPIQMPSIGAHVHTIVLGRGTPCFEHHSHTPQHIHTVARLWCALLRRADSMGYNRVHMRVATGMKACTCISACATCLS